MEYSGPDTSDLVQVEALNRAFLEHVAGEGRKLADGLPPALASALVQSGRVARARIAKCPFLLFSMNEHDERTWSGLFADGPRPDLVDALARPAGAELRILSASLAFLWQLANDNPYGARVVSGAPGDWCDRLAGCVLVEAFEFVAHRPGLLCLRLGDNAAFWRRVLLACGSDEAEIRRAARVTALHLLLTCPTDARRRQLPAAACAMTVPALEVADRSPVSRDESRRYNTPPHDGPVHPTTRKDLRQR